MFTEVLIWLLQRDLLNMLHVRVRIIATADIKRLVWTRRSREKEEKMEEWRRDNESSSEEGPGSGSDELSDGRPHTHQRKSSDSPGIDITFEASSPEITRAAEKKRQIFRSAASEGSEDSEYESDWDGAGFDGEDWGTWEELEDSIIAAPAKATRMERRWLDAMREGKEPSLQRAFER